jgi:hypothetical protein
MHSVSPIRSRSSSAIRSSMRAVHPDDSRDQSSRPGTRSSGSFASSPPISSSDSPTRWAKTMNAILRSVTRHPVDKPDWAARRIEGEDDVRDVVALMRLNYDRAVARHGMPAEA